MSFDNKINKMKAKLNERLLFLKHQEENLKRQSPGQKIIRCGDWVMSEDQFNRIKEYKPSEKRRTGLLRVEYVGGKNPSPEAS
jgi:hypothetical protein